MILIKASSPLSVLYHSFFLCFDSFAFFVAKKKKKKGKKIEKGENSGMLLMVNQVKVIHSYFCTSSGQAAKSSKGLLFLIDISKN